MNPHSMPEELVELENRLRGRANDAPTADLRNRVMRAVAAELARPEQLSSVRQWDNRYWAAIAAAVLIILHLSMISASRDEFSIRPMRSRNQMTTELQSLRQLEAQQEGMLK